MSKDTGVKVGNSRNLKDNQKNVDSSMLRCKSEEKSEGSKNVSVLKASIFNLFFQEYSQDIWTSCEPELSAANFLDEIEGEIYAKDWCFRISKDKKMEWLYVVFKDQYALAYNNESCKTPIAYFDLNFTKLDYLQIEMGDDQDQKSYYG